MDITKPLKKKKHREHLKEETERRGNKIHHKLPKTGKLLYRSYREYLNKAKSVKCRGNRKCQCSQASILWVDVLQ